jgi:hypothetical protein
MFLVVSILLWSHLVGHLHVGGAGGDQQRGAYVPELVLGVADDAVAVGGGVALGKLEVLAPGGVAEGSRPVDS